ncbi:hypothetical protein [Leptolyngbya sp. O-77]|uniref:hypothetical protein n=1 Tax=Leptolyngbya sp. O-77 TaxID=1080068 RepID=UPI00074D3080|nr:hypothetical protein [Leptolyngbya sp. O-77]BAU44742.1 hypothetical protein O77CONTIG1_04587 [Leptolyngbya sp. O-77]
MLTVQYTWSSPRSEATQFSLPPLTCELPRRRRLRHYIIGLPEDAQLAIDRLHLLRYAERFEWTRALEFPPNGIVLNAEQPGEVLRCLHREVRSNPGANE